MGFGAEGLARFRDGITTLNNLGVGLWPLRFRVPRNEVPLKRAMSRVKKVPL